MAASTQRSEFGKASDRLKATSAVGLIMPLLALTLIAGVGGGFIGVTVSSPQSVASTLQQDGAKRHSGKKRGDESEVCSAPTDRREDAVDALALKLKELPPVVTNLGNPEAVWVRLQAAIVYDEKLIPNVEILASQMRSDIVAFLRATSLSSIQGADGLRRLHEELSDRASIRSENRVKEFIIETFVVQ